ncbi:PLP-dependent aminotransferase family protein [Tersicoccus sp. MR15.9]|uniref:aminotransferase-like domain-containing protein n=1 Tax=Tersicoccus mangrovi TaxID=3121635 RepID=UPI002FE6448A
MSDDSTGRIVAGLRAWIATARPGTRLPSNRALVAEYGASPVTVQKAMRQLIGFGLAESRPGVGTFVRAARTPSPVDYGWQTTALGAPPSLGATLSSTQRTAAPDAIGLHMGYPSRELLPERLVRQALARAARSDGALRRSPAAGLPDLRAWFAAELASGAPAGVTPAGPRDTLVLSGSQSGLSSIFRALVGPGQPMLIESPSYWGAILAAHQAGVTLVPLPSGANGPDPLDVERAFARTGARAFYAQPTFANPTGGQWPAETGLAVLETVRRHGAFLIEDDWAHDLAIDADPRPLAALDDDGHVIYLRSLTKSVSPALRVAAVVARGPARDRILADRAAESMYVSAVLQSAALDVVAQPGWRTHLRGLRDQLRGRRDLLLASLREHAPAAHVESVPSGGLNLWLRLPEGTEVGQVVRDCESRGLIIAPGSEWFPAEPSGPYVRVNYGGDDPDRFPEAAAILGGVLAAR